MSKTMTIIASLLIGLTLVLNACGPAATTPPPTTAVLQPTTAPTDTVAPAATDTPAPEKTLPPSSGPCPEDQAPTESLTFEKDPEKITTEKGDIYIQTGIYKNQDGQTFSITVTGRQEQAVTNYTSGPLYVCFAAIETQIPAKENVEGKEPGEPIDDLLADSNTENLIIDVEFHPTDEQGKHFQELKGYTVVMDIDPGINNGSIHCYRRQGDPPTETLWMENCTNCGKGKVQGWMAKNGTPGTAVTLAPPNHTTIPSAGTGSARYALVVKGLQDGSRYKVTGTWWNTYNYGSPSPTPPPPPGVCP